MKQEIFEIVKLILQIVLIAMTAFVVPAVRNYLLKTTTAKQREDLLFWTKVAVKTAEDIYKQKGQGILKKEYVLNWIQEQKIPISAEQASVLVDMIVSEFNKNGWDKVIPNGQ